MSAHNTRTEQAVGPKKILTKLVSRVNQTV
jgi:hypothetical protein